MKGKITSCFLFSVLRLILSCLLDHAEGYCGSLNVENAKYQLQIDGSYGTYGSYLCYSNYFWQQSNNYNTYIVYLQGIVGVKPNATVSGWVIASYPSGTAPCLSTILSVMAINQQPMDTEPYDITNSWYERNGQTYVANYDLDVQCSDDLSGWAIFGIVMASICGFILLLSIIACCCSKHSMKKRRTTAAGAAVYTSNNPNVCTIVTVTDPAHSPSGIPATVPHPPAYDNSAPPAYDTITFTTYPAQEAAPGGNSGLEQGENVKVDGITNEGYRP